MNNNDLTVFIDNESATNRTRSTKRKWREIEAIKDRYRLRKELAEIDLLTDTELSEIEI